MVSSTDLKKEVAKGLAPLNALIPDTMCVKLSLFGSLLSTFSPPSLLVLEAVMVNSCDALDKLRKQSNSKFANRLPSNQLENGQLGVKSSMTNLI